MTRAEGEGALEGAGEVVGGDPWWEADAIGPDRHPGTVGLVEHEQRGGVVAEQVVQAQHGAVERLVHVEGSRQRLGDPVQGEQQRVGVGQLAVAVERPAPLELALAEDAAGVAGDDGDEQELDDPLGRGAGIGARRRRVGGRHDHDLEARDGEGEGDAAAQPGDHDRRDHGEGERGPPAFSGGDGAGDERRLGHDGDDEAAATAPSGSGAPSVRG